MNSWKSILLDGQWDLYIAEHKETILKSYNPSTNAELKSCGMLHIPARVPGNFELDLFEAGLIEDPFYALNPILIQKYENRHLWYTKSFQFSGNAGQSYLMFEGLDTFSDVYINGVLVLTTDNMLIPYEVAVPMLKNGINEIVVHIKPSAIVSRDMEVDAGCYSKNYNTSSLKVRKAPHMYGWDIMPRVLTGGIWKSVYIREKPADRIDSVFLETVKINGDDHTATLRMFYETTVSADLLTDYRIEISGGCEDSSFSMIQRLWHNCGHIFINVTNVKLWWPNSLGEPKLYDIKVSIYNKDTILDTYSIKFGIRKIELIRTSTTDKKGNGEFCFIVNGERVFVKGTNWVPVDAFHSRDKERLPRVLEMLTDLKCNAVRCWGGNVYENDIFYDFCDSNGIIVWQDFAMACAMYPQDPEFCSALSQEVKKVVIRLRNHCCIAVWAGDNECDQSYMGWNGSKNNPNDNVLTRRVIPDVLKRCDPTRPYLPSSPYIDQIAYQTGAQIPEEHLWGPRDYYKSPFYTNTEAHFASEIGYHGCNSPKSIEKFISREKLWPWKDNDEWIIHASSPEVDPNAAYAYRIELMAKQVREMFGFIPDNLPEFALASQISQAEAFKFFIEFFRCAKWRRTGIIWWNLMDGWPQFSDAVVDYYFCKKLAYHFIKRSQQPVCLMFSEPENWGISLIGSNDTLSEITVNYSVKNMTDNQSVVLEGSGTLLPNSAKKLGSLKYSTSEKNFYLIEWEYNGIKGKNHYLSGKPAFDLQVYLDCLKASDMLTIEGF